jgi:hypothetical protein
MLKLVKAITGVPVAKARISHFAMVVTKVVNLPPSNLWLLSQKQSISVAASIPRMACFVMAVIMPYKNYKKRPGLQTRRWSCNSGIDRNHPNMII